MQAEPIVSSPPSWSDWLTVDRIVDAQVGRDDHGRGAAVILRDGALELAGWQIGLGTVRAAGLAAPMFDQARWLTVWAVSEESRKPALSSGTVPRGVPFESVVFSSRDRTNVQAWLARPATPGPVPTVVHAHGGPHWQVGDTFNPTAQVWVANNFAYLDVNFRGSTGRGTRFMQQIWGDVGRLELEDLVAARAWLVENEVALPDQIFVVGESYGGFLALYAVGREPDLWAAAIVEAAVGDWSLTYRDASPMLQAALRTWFQGTPDERADLYRDRSPLTWAERVNAPVYAIQGRNDTRTAPAQLTAYIDRLQQLGKPVVVDWVDAGHAEAARSQAVHFMMRRLDFADAVLRMRTEGARFEWQ